MTEIKTMTTEETQDCPTMQVRIDKTTYIVKLHFNENAKETFEDKIKRLIQDEVLKMVGA